MNVRTEIATEMAAHDAALITPRSFKVMVLAAGETVAVSNGLRFPTGAAAESYAVDLACRWLAVRSWEVVGSDDEPNR